MSHDRGSAPAGVSCCAVEWDMWTKTQRGSMGVQCEEGEPGVTKKRWCLKATTFQFDLCVSGCIQWTCA